jgi:hypothetical protein
MPQYEFTFSGEIDTYNNYKLTSYDIDCANILVNNLDIWKSILDKENCIISDILLKINRITLKNPFIYGHVLFKSNSMLNYKKDHIQWSLNNSWSNEDNDNKLKWWCTIEDVSELNNIISLKNHKTRKNRKNRKSRKIEY